MIPFLIASQLRSHQQVLGSLLQNLDHARRRVSQLVFHLRGQS